MLCLTLGLLASSTSWPWSVSSSLLARRWGGGGGRNSIEPRGVVELLMGSVSGGAGGGLLSALQTLGVLLVGGAGFILA